MHTRGTWGKYRLYCRWCAGTSTPRSSGSASASAASTPLSRDPTPFFSPSRDRVVFTDEWPFCGYIYIYKFSVLVFLWFCFFLFSSWNREAIVARFLTRTSFGVSSPCFSRKRKKARARAGLGERLAHVLPRLRTAPNESGVLFMTPNDRPLSENSKRCF